MDTRRAAAMDGGRFPIEPWNGESENADATHSAAGDLSRKGAFFWLLFFAPAKKSNSRVSAKAFDFRPSSELQHFGAKINTFRAVARGTFFCWPKRKYPKKRAFPDTPPAALWVRRHFRTRHSMARYENGRHPWRPPSGCACIRASRLRNKRRAYGAPFRSRLLVRA